eukprot:2541138-Ditylum_brightwellii.AAC.1
MDTTIVCWRNRDGRELMQIMWERRVWQRKAGTCCVLCLQYAHFVMGRIWDPPMVSRLVVSWDRSDLGPTNGFLAGHGIFGWCLQWVEYWGGNIPNPLG